MAPTSTMNAASGAKGMGIQCITVRISTNACSAMESGTGRNNVASPTNDAEPDESATSLMTTLEWPILTAP
jgi:hypothetical protein